MMMKNSRREILAGALTVAVLPTAGFAQSRPAQPLDVKIVNSNSTTELTFEKLLRTQGYLEEFGVNATTVNVSDGGKVMASLISGDMDVCMKSGFGQVLPAVERGGPIKLIAGAIMLTPQAVLTNKREVQSLADLKGKRIGTGPIGALEHQLMVAVLVKHDISPDAVTFVNIGSTTDIFRAISAGVIDAGPVNVDVSDRLKGDLRFVADFWTELPEFPYQGSFASDAAIKTKRETLVRTLAAYLKMYRYLRTPESKDPYIRAYTAAVGGSAVDGEKQWQFLYDNKAFTSNLIIPDQALSFIQTLNLRTSVQKTELPLSKFSDMSLAQEAAKLVA